MTQTTDQCSQELITIDEEEGQEGNDRGRSGARDQLQVGTSGSCRSRPPLAAGRGRRDGEAVVGRDTGRARDQRRRKGIALGYGEEGCATGEDVGVDGGG